MNGLWAAYKLNWKRRRLLWRSLRSRHDLTPVADRTSGIQASDILAVTVMRNEAKRLPWFLRYHRGLGVGHFLFVDNGSEDDTVSLLADQPDISLWRTNAAYRDSRFGLDWANWLLMRYGHGHWCLMLDADELLVYPHCDSADLKDLTAWLDQTGRAGFGALMLDLYGKGPLGQAMADADSDPTRTLCWFDPGPYRAQRQKPLNNLWVQGGARERMFFGADPVRSPTLNKLPLMRWNRRWAFVNSCHSILPRRLNALYSGPGGSEPSGVLLHTKFLSDVLDRAAEDTARRQHFNDPDRMRDYYDLIAQRPDLWHEGSVKLAGWRQLQDLGLMCSGDWQGPASNSSDQKS